MDMISIRRKLMAMQNKPAPTGYVTDGLVLWLDGINKGNDNTKWPDLVQGLVFAKAGGSSVPPAVFGDDYVEFVQGNNTFYTNNNFVSPLASDGTIEVVYSDSVASTSRVILMTGVDGAIEAHLTASNTGVFVASNIDSDKLPVIANIPTSGAVSWSNQMAFVNGSQAQMGSTNRTGFNAYQVNAGTSVGRRVSNIGTQYNPFVGKIYCIRIYDRQLTRAEVLANYAVDRSRFSLFN